MPSESFVLSRILSYDLGATGDYEGMYAWLDDQDAKECGSSVAFVEQYDHDDEDLMAKLESDIDGAVDLNRRSRIYVIRFAKKGPKRRLVGSFLIGGRKGAPPWDGYGQQDETDDDEG